MTAEDFLAVQDQPAGSSPVAESFLDGPDAGMGSPMQGNPQGAFTAPSTVTPQSFGPSMTGSMLVPSNGQAALESKGNLEGFAFAPEESSSGPSLVDVASLTPSVAKQITGGIVKAIGVGAEQTAKVLNSIGGDPYGMSWATPSTPQLSGLSELGHEVNKKGQDLINQDPELAATSTGKIAQGYGNMAGVIGTSVVNPWAGGAIFAGGVAQHMADAAEKAGKSSEVIEQARQTGYGLGMATMMVPTAAVLKTLRGMNVNPYVSQLGENLVVLLPEATTQSKMLYTGIEAAKSGTIGAMSGAAYQIAQNAALNHYGDQKIPLTQGVGESAALFGIPSAIGGGIAAVSNLRAADQGASRMKQGIDAMPRANGTTVSESPAPAAEAFLDAPAEAAQSAKPISGAIEDVPKGAFTMTQDGTPPVRPAPEVIPMPSGAVQYLEAPASSGSPEQSVGNPSASAEDFLSSSEVATPAQAAETVSGELSNPENPVHDGSIKGQILANVDQALSSAPDKPYPETHPQHAVTFSVPGDGTFTLVNNKVTLDRFRKRVEAMPTQIRSTKATVPKSSATNPILSRSPHTALHAQVNESIKIYGSIPSAIMGISSQIHAAVMNGETEANLSQPHKILHQLQALDSASLKQKSDLEIHEDSSDESLTPDDARSFIAQAITDHGLVGEIIYRPVNDREVEDVKSQGGPDISGMNHTLDAEHLRHALNVHSDPVIEAARGQRPLTQEDVLRIPEVLDHYDQLTYQNAGTNKKSIIYSKSFSDGRVEYVERTIETSLKHSPRLVTRTAWVKSELGRDAKPISVYTPVRQTEHTTEGGQINPQPDSDQVKMDRDSKGKPPKQVAAPVLPTPEIAPESPAASSPARGTSSIKSGISAYLHGMTLPIRRVLFPATLDEAASQIAHMIRDLNGARAIAIQRADVALAKWRSAFDRTPVLREWTYDPTKPLPANYAFIQAVESGNVANLPKDQQDLALLMRQQLDERIAQVQELNPEALKSLIDNYFPHVWKNPDAANAAISKVSPAARPLEGSKAFLRKRTLSYFTDGLKSGLVPVSDNPVDIHLFKLAEMDRFIMAHRILNDANAAGLRKFIGVFSPKPEGWSKVEDRTSTVFAPPFVTVKEAFDQNLRKGAEDFIKKMGWNYDRVIGKFQAAGFKRNTWGFWQPATDTLKVREFSTEKTLFHEIGHGMDQHFGLSEWIDKRVPKSVQETELKRLSDARNPNAKGKHYEYIHSRDERMAEITATYVTAPDFLRENCPETLKAYQAFLDAHPELWGIRDLRPGLERGIRDVEVPVHGQVTLGHWYMPDGAAQVLNNYLSPGLSNRGWYRSIRSISNLLNSATLGLSAFHLGFTSLEAVASQVSVGLWQALHGHPIKAGKLIISSPAAPVTNYYRGKALQRAMLHPDQATGTMRGLADLALKAGLRATIDPFWKTEFTRNFRKALAGVRMNLASGTIPKGEALRVITNLIPMIIEQSMRPIAEILVPRQKLGVFAEMMHAELQRLGPSASLNDLRAAAARSADSTEDRLGQMTYDNLFHNKVAKDLLLIAFRAYGWQLGKYRAISKAIGEGVGAANDLLHLRKPKVSTNLTYFPALVMVAGIMGAITQKILSGKDPESVKDLFLPRSGKIDGQGHEQRLALPTYLKDLISDWHDAPDLKKMGVSFWHKLNPALSIACDAFNNKDFYGTEIRHDDDPAWKQAFQFGQFLAKSFIPFSVTGTMKLQESGAGPGEMALPFIGIVPAKKVLTETPAEARAEELYAGTLPQGSRTQDQTDHAHLLNQIKSQMRMDPAKGTQLLAQNAGQLHTLDFNSIFKDNGVPQIILHTKQLTIDQGMSVFDMATDLERQQLAPVLLQKLGNAVNNRAIDPMVASRYAKVLTLPR